MPTIERLMISGGSNKQTTGTGASLTEAEAEKFIDNLRNVYIESQAIYKSALANGVPKELARLCVPVARYSCMRASANLRNWLAFLTLRMNQAAQYEIRMYANAVGSIIAELFPRTWELFIESRG
jgi:thymidylate synthase (FAD)